VAKNSVELIGIVSWKPAPYFDLVATQRREEPVPFLRFNLLVKRDGSQDDGFPHDSIRVVAYGVLAERIYPVLEQEAELAVSGWLQSRKTPKGTVLEVVARQITSTSQVIPYNTLKRLRATAARYGLEVRELTRLLLEPQLAAVEAASGEGEQDGD